MTDEDPHDPLGPKTDPPDPAANLAQHRKILAEAESIAELFVNASYPLLAKHTSGGLRATLAVETACIIHLADAIRDHTAATREQTELVRKRETTSPDTGDDR